MCGERLVGAKVRGAQGKNVNGWHWEEKDCFSYVKEKLTTIFKDFEVFQNDKYKIYIKKLETIKGEAFLTNRKQ